MQKKLLAVAMAALFAPFAAQAADIEVYGLIDTGLVFNSIDTDKAGSDRESSLTMNSSVSTPNRWGLRSSENIGDGLTVGFNLEGQFGSDDGSMTNSRLFQRMSQIWIKSDTYGTLIMGRSGALRSGMGTTGIWGPKIAAFSNSWGNYMVGSKYLMPGGFGSLDNAITYQSPVMNGAQIHLQYSSKMNQVTDTAGEEFEGSSDRTWGVGMTYTAGPLHVVAVVDSILYGNVHGNANYDDSLMASLGAAYQFDGFKLYASAAGFKSMKGSNFLGHNGLETFMKPVNGVEPATYKGYSLQLGADIRAGVGTVKVNVGWMDAQVDDVYLAAAEELDDTDRIGLSAGYVHPLSKRTSLYAGAGVTKGSSSVNQGADPVAYEVVTGMVHSF